MVFSENISALKLAENPVFHQFIRDVLKYGIISVGHVSTEDMLADLMTRALTKGKHKKWVKIMGLTMLTIDR